MRPTGTKFSHTTKRWVTCAVCGLRFFWEGTFSRMAEQGTASDVTAAVWADALRWSPLSDCGRHK